MPTTRNRRVATSFLKSVLDERGGGKGGTWYDVSGIEYKSGFGMRTMQQTSWDELTHVGSCGSCSTAEISTSDIVLKTEHDLSDFRHTGTANTRLNYYRRIALK